MLKKKDNDALTRVGPRTSGGKMLRRYWQPVALAEELPPGGEPVTVRLMDEDLVLFRDENNHIGLIGLHCPHRGTDLSYGRIEAGGLRCLYHGWVWDVNGKCLEQPCEPEGSKFKGKVKNLAFPCIERVGLIFAYLGPGEPPLLPAYEFLVAPPEYVHVNKTHMECNYAQGNEGNIDPAHLSFLHTFDETKVDPNSKNLSPLAVRDPNPVMETEITDFGLRIHTLRDAAPDGWYLRVTNFILPNLSAFPGGSLTGGYTVNWHVPIDDTNHWKYQIILTRTIDRALLDKTYFEDGITEDYMPVRNSANRYLQDRKIMKTWSYSGIGPKPGSNFTAQDAFAIVTQGAIQDRTREHLGYGDKVIVQARKLMLKAITDVQKGKEPAHVVRDAAKNSFDHLVIRGELIKDKKDWMERWKLPQEGEIRFR
ncbi:MAG: Rieske 2Fe-2S domain-containing protein [Burkholderiales bacterium]